MHFCGWGYSVDHANDVYRMLNIATKRIVHTRDVVWLDKSYKHWVITNSPSRVNNDDDIEDFIHNIATLKPEANKIEGTQVTQGMDQIVKSKVYPQLKQLESNFSPDASKIVKDIEQGKDIILDQANIALFSGNIQVEPTTFDQAWNYSDPKDQEK